MIDSKKALVVIGMSVVLSSYLVADFPSCTLVDGKYQVKNNSNVVVDDSLKTCVYHATNTSADAVVSFLEGMTITLGSDINIGGDNHITIDAEGQEVVISGNDITNILIDENSNKITLKDLIITNGYLEGDYGGAGLKIDNLGDIDITNVAFLDNNTSGDGYGGAIDIANEDAAADTDVVVNITDSTFTRNSSRVGGAIHSGTGVELNIDNTSFTQNDDLISGYSYKSCAGVYADSNGKLAIKNSSFHDNKTFNTSGHNGVAVHADISTLLDINNTTFSSHSAVYDGSSTTTLIKMSSSGNLTINESEFYDNNISIMDISLQESNATISNSIFRDNIIEEGQLVGVSANNINVESSEFINNSCIFGIFGSEADKTTINNSVFTENSAEGCAAIHSIGYDTLIDITISNTTISGNSAVLGSAVCAKLSKIKIINSTISGNTALYHDTWSSSYSGAILVDESNLTIESSTIVNNSGENGTLAGILNLESSSYIELSNTILTNNIVNSLQSNMYGSLDIVQYSIVGSDVNLPSEPTNLKGIDPKLGELKDNGGDTKTHALLSGSPAIDAGYSTIPLDQRGEERDESPDIGSYEYQGGGGANPAIIMYLLN